MIWIGLLGGTFDPVHFGHLRCAVEAGEVLELDELRLLPCQVSPHRTPGLAGATQRLRMLELAAREHPALCIDARELDRPPPSYTVDTLAEVHAENPDSGLIFIVGQDAFGAFRQWHRWQEILALAHLAVTTRPGYPLDLDGFRVATDLRRLRELRHGLVFPCPVTALDISATDIRARAGRGADLSFLLPDRVRDYIERERLYAAE